MAPVRYSKTVPDPDRVLAIIADCRAAMILAGTRVRPFGPAYHAVHMVTAAIDGLATFMTGERHYFATRLRGDPPHATAAPCIDLDESPHPTREELAPFQPKDR